MRATTGAIERVRIGDDVAIQVIGGGRPKGICGSGLIDALAELRGSGFIDPTGHLAAPPSGRPGSRLLERLTEYKGERAFRLAPHIYLTQSDIRQLQLAKAATRAGTEVLKRLGGIADEEIRRVLLAGAFGSYCRPESALAIGLLPPVPLNRIIPVGNAASTGAKMALLNLRARRQAEALARRLKHVDLSRQPDFQDKFIAAMHFPAAGKKP